METASEGSGKISTHFTGIGPVTDEMVDQRAIELARINGRTQVNESDRSDAKRELLVLGNPASEEQEPTIAAVTTWDEEPGSTGRHIPNKPASDEQTVAERLVEEGVEEAAHEQMVEGSKPGRE